MLQSKLRLSNELMRRVLQKGQSVFSETLQLKFFRVSSDSPHFAFVVSKKISRGAFVRNRIRRLLRNATFHVYKKNPSAIYGVFIVKQYPKDVSLAFYIEEIERCLLAAQL